MTKVGDLHNFGQAVRCSYAPNGDSYFEKPRTLFWEHLFFGIDSPLKAYLPEEIRSLFGLEIEFRGGGQIGRSKRVLHTGPDETSASDYFQFGILLGYSYAFGLQDLHVENVVKTKAGLQVIDAEVVLTKFTLPHESLLLPYRDTPFEKSALSLLAPGPILPVESVTAILNGFSSALTSIASQAHPLADVIETQINKTEIPIRVLLRDTFRYRDWRTASNDPALLPEEREQLERGDIPYFFKFPGGAKLFFYTAENLTFSEVHLPKKFEEGVKAIGVAPADLITHERIMGTLFPSGTLFLLRKLLPSIWTGDIACNGFNAVITSEKISVCSAVGNFSATRTRAIKP